MTNVEVDRNTVSAGSAVNAEPTHTGPVYRPAVDITERNNEVVVQADIPGVAPENVDIHFEAGVLTVRGRVTRAQRPNATPILREYGIGDYERTFRIDGLIDAARISAEAVGGVLTVRLPKSEAALPRKIPVQSRA